MFYGSIWNADRSDIRRQLLADALLETKDRRVFLKELGAIVGRMAGDPIPDEKLATNGVFHGTKYRRLLSDDIDQLNRNMEYPYTIISDKNGVRICNQLDSEHLFAMERKEALKKLAKCMIVAQKASLDTKISISMKEIREFADQLTN